MRPIFVNLPVRDLPKSKDFFSSLGFGFEPKFTFIPSRTIRAGGKPFRDAQDHGFMDQHAFEDPDGPIWELVHMRGEPK